MYIKISKTRDVKIPARANPGDAGLDFYVPNDFKPVTLKHGESILIPAGVKVEVPFGRALVFENKSGVASKKRLDIMACVIDHGYSGEVHINMINNGESDASINPGDKIAQAVMYVIDVPQVIEVNETELYQSIHVASNRGEGGFGSTGTK